MSGNRGYRFLESFFSINQQWKQAHSASLTKYLISASLLLIAAFYFYSRVYLNAGPTADIYNFHLIHLVYLIIISLVTFQYLKLKSTLQGFKTHVGSNSSSFERLSDSGMIGFLFVRMDGKIVKTNQAFLDMIGYTQEEMDSGLINWATLTPDEFKNITHASVEQLKNNGACLPFEKEYIRKDGTRVNVMLASAKLENTDFADAITYVIDITEKKQAQFRVEQLNHTLAKQKQELLRLLMNAPAMISLRRGPELRLEFMNQASLEYAGTSSHLGLTPKEITEKFNIETGTEIMERVYNTGERFAGKAFHLRFDRIGNGKKEDAWFDFVLEPMLDADGNIDGVASFGFDVTDMVKANKEIKESETRFRFLADSLQHKIWTSGPDGKATYYNKGWYDYLTADSFEELSTAIWNAIHPDDLETATKSWDNAILSGEDIELEQRLKDKTGIYKWHLIRCCAHKDENGNIIMWVGSCTNIHEQKLAQEATRLLSQKKDEFLGIASHELKTPITSMQASLQILDTLADKEFDARKVKTFVGMANKQVKKLNLIVDDLLDVTKIQAGKMQLNRTSYSFQNSLQDCIDEMQAMLLSQCIIIEQNDQVTITADKVRIEQVIINLLSNGIKYSQANSTIRIKVEQLGQLLKFSVTDDGIGIPKEKQALVFEKFSRAHESSQKFSGLGLGLYISLQIIEQHGGTMSLISEVGQGSTFWFTLPLTS
jgi:PAS domain S-box-containing protein